MATVIRDTSKAVTIKSAAVMPAITIQDRYSEPVVVAPLTQTDHVITEDITVPAQKVVIVALQDAEPRGVDLYCRDSLGALMHYLQMSGGKLRVVIDNASSTERVVCISYDRITH